MAANTKLKTFARSLEGELNQRGFKSVNAKRINARLMREGLLKNKGSCGIVTGREKILNRGIGSKRSNFNVFIKLEGRRVLVYYMNPDSVSKSAPMLRRNDRWKILPGENYNILKVCNGTQNPVEYAEKVAKDIAYYASLKPENEYRMETHLHAGWMYGGFKGGSKRIADDGMPNIIHVLRVMAHTNRDVVALTSHNAFNAKQFRAMQIIAQEMGMVMVPSVELTMPGKTPNGPHVCCNLADAGLAMHEFKTIALRGRSNYSMPPFNDAGKLPDILERLYTSMVLGSGELFMSIAHPFNFYTKERHLYEVGLLSSIECGPYPFDSVMDMLPFFQAVEGWNMGMSDKSTIPRLKNKNLEEYIHEICTKHLPPGTKATPNSIAYAFAQEMRHEGTIFHTQTGTDDHRTVPMNYRSNGLPQVRGHTEIDMGKVYANMADRKPTAGELIKWLLANDVLMTGFVYLEHEDGYLRVPKGRKSYDKHTSSLVKKMYSEGKKLYEKAVARDIFSGRVKPDELVNLAHSFGIWD